MTESPKIPTLQQKLDAAGGAVPMLREPDSRRDNVGANSLREIRVTVAPTPYFAKVIKSGS